MDFYELIQTIREENDETEAAVMRHNLNGASGFEVSEEVRQQVVEAAREQFGDTIELYHGTEVEVSENLNWRENSSFTDEFDIEFAGEDGFIVVAQIPVERIKFYLEEENEFVVSAGKLDCKVFAVSEYFGL